MKRQLRLNNEFERWLDVPFFTDDTNAYELVYNLGEKGKGCYFKVTATRADGVSITDIGDVSENGIISYTLAGNMYGVEGELILRVQVLNGDTALTEKILYAKVEKGESGTENPSTGQPAINNLLARIEQKVDKVEGKQLSTEDFTTEEKKKLENTVGEKSEGENSAIFGSSTNEFKELELPDKIYYKPIAEEYYEEKITNNKVAYSPLWESSSISYSADYSPLEIPRWLNVGDICLLEGILYNPELSDPWLEGEKFSGYVKITAIQQPIISGEDEYGNTLYSDYGYINYKPLSNFLPETGQRPYALEVSLTLVKANYKFENLTFTTDENDTLLEKLYTYTDLRGNKCYTVYKDYTPDRADGSTNIAKSKVYELTEDKALANSQPTIYKYDSEGMLKGLRYEALFNQGVYFAVADGENTFSSGEDNVASGDDAFSVGYRNIVLADGSTALGRMLLVRGVGANGFGLNGKATGRYAIAFNEAGRALGYASLVFGDHCGAYDYYDVAGGFKSIAKGGTSFAFGTEVEASGNKSIAFGNKTKAIGNMCLVGGNQNTCTGIGALVYGLTNTVSGNYGLTVGQNNDVTGSMSIVGGMSNEVHAPQVLVIGNANEITDGFGSAIFGNKNKVYGRNGSAAFGMENKIVTERGFAVGFNNIVDGVNSACFGQGNEITGKDGLCAGYKNKIEHNQCVTLGRRLVTAEDRQTIVGVGNTSETNAVFIAGAGRNNETDGGVDKNAIVVRRNTGYVELPQGLVLISPNKKNKFLLKVSDDGTLSTERVY